MFLDCSPVVLAVPVKVCKKCDEVKVLDDFPRDKNRPDGRFPYCKACSCARSRAWATANPEKKAASDKAYREANRDRLLSRQRAYTKENAEQARSRAKAWYWNNRERTAQDRAAKKERIAAARELYRQEHREELARRKAEYDKAYNAANKERRARADRTWRTANKERKAASDKAWREANKERDAANHHEYYLANQDDIKARSKDWYKVNRERIRPRASITTKEWAQRNPERARARTARYRTRKRGLQHDFSVSNWQAALDYFGGRCAVCGRQPGLWHTLAADHWIPLDSPDCPGTVTWNMVPLCHGVDGCNNSKQHRLASEWLIDKFGAKKGRAILKRIEAFLDSRRTAS